MFTYVGLDHLTRVHRGSAVTTNWGRLSSLTSVAYVAGTEVLAVESSTALPPSRKEGTCGRKRTFPNVPCPAAQVTESFLKCYYKCSQLRIMCSCSINNVLLHNS